MEISNKALYRFSVTLIGIGILVVIIFSIRLTGFFSLLGSDLDMNATGQVGDFIGGIVGSIWSLAGVILFFLALNYQRKEFELQRIELEENRTEFIINRLTNVIYQQLNRYESALKEVDLITLKKLTSVKAVERAMTSGIKETTLTEGILAILEYNRHLGRISLQDFEKLEGQELKKEIDNINRVLELVAKNSNSIIPFLSASRNSISVINNIIGSSKLTPQQKDELKSIFNGNIASEIRTFYIGIYAVTESYVQLLRVKKIQPNTDYYGEILDMNSMARELARFSGYNV